MQSPTMVRGLTRYWWAFGLRSALAVLFGIAAFAGMRFRWRLLVLGIVGIAAGIVAFVWPGLTALTLVYVVAAWALVTGVVQIAAAIRLREVIEGEWLLGFSGQVESHSVSSLAVLLSIVFGVLLMIFPGAGVLSLVWVIGIYAIILGVALVGLGLRLRRWHTMAVDADRQPTARPTAG